VENNETENSVASHGYPVCCPILEQTADGVNCGRCWHTLDGSICPRHGDVGAECDKFAATGIGTIENVMRQRKGLSRLGNG
jgi:hypothetical protein